MSQVVKRHSGSALITVLLLISVLLILGMAFLTQRVQQSRAASAAESAAVARALAEAGLEDARVKLEKDQGFPPTDNDTQLKFSYTEEMTPVGGGAAIGSYTVTVDLEAKEDHSVVVVHSIGRVANSDPVVQTELYAELDLSGTISSNPKFFRYITVEDR